MAPFFGGKLLLPEGIVALDAGDGEQGHIGEDGPAEAAQWEGVGGAGAGVGAAAGDGDGAGGGEAGVERGTVEHAVVLEDHFDGFALLVRAVHDDAAGVACEPAADLEVAELGFGGFDDDGLFAFFEEDEAVGVAAGVFVEGLMPDGGPVFALEESPELFTDTVGEIALSVDVVVVSGGGDLEIVDAVVFAGIDDLCGAGDLAVRSGEDPVVHGAIGIGSAEGAVVRGDGEGGDEVEPARGKGRGRGGGAGGRGRCRRDNPWR